MYNRILVPLDGSPLSEQVLPYLRILSQDLTASLTLLRVVNPRPEFIADPAHGVYVDTLVQAFWDTARESLDRYKEYLSDLGIPIFTNIEEGDPASHIIQAAEEVPDTLIAMSTHGRSGVSRWLLGSVTDKVLHATSLPLLIVRTQPLDSFSAEAIPTPTQRWPASVEINCITVPLDGSSLAEQVLPQVVNFAQCLKVKVRLVRVTPAPEEDPEASHYLSEVADRLGKQGIASVEQHVLHGDPAEAIMVMAEPDRDSLVAMTTRGRSGIGRWMLGSVTDRVVRYCGQPVLVVRASTEAD